MRYVLLTVAASLQKATKTKGLFTHMVYFSVAMDCKSPDSVSPCLVYTLPFIFVCAHATAALIIVMLISMPPPPSLCRAAVGLC